MSFTDVKTSIELFLERNNLLETLRNFKNQMSNQNQKARSRSSPDKQALLIKKKQAYQLQKLSITILDYSNPQIQNQLRQYFQRTDLKLLKKFFDRMKKSTANEPQAFIANRTIDGNEEKFNLNKQSKTANKATNLKTQTKSKRAKIEQMKFFKKLLQKESEENQYIRGLLQNKKNKIKLLEQSRQFQNEWQNANEYGYEFNQFINSQFVKVYKQLRSLRTAEHLTTIVKQSLYPKSYYEQISCYKQRSNLNAHDKFYSRFPSHAKFIPENQIKILNEFQAKTKKDLNNHKPSQRLYDLKYNQTIYPLELNDVVYDSYELKIIYDRDKTGFQEERDLKIVINQVLAGKYQIISNLGQAQYSNTIEVKDLTNHQRYCLKIIQNNKQYFDQSLDEIRILRYIKANCNPDENCLLNLHDYFYHKEHLMLLTELLNDTLQNAYLTNRETFQNLRNIQTFTRQILIGLSKLHQLHIIHADLKPENIMIKSYSNKTIKIIDFGSSVFFHDESNFHIQTRSYRAPEIILGISYDAKIDIWSMACIIAEIFTGQILFQAESEASLLALMQGLRGPWPSWMLEKGLKVDNYFTKDLFIYEQVLDEDKSKTGKTRIYTPKLTNMKSRIKSENKVFLDFLSKCLKLDPSQRLSAKQALRHPFITESISN